MKMKHDSREGLSSSAQIARFTCVYCHNVINRGDTQCPHCGAETASSLQKFMEMRNAETEHCKTQLKAIDSRRRHRVIGIVCAFLAVVMLSVLLFLLAGQKSVKNITVAALALAYAVYLVAGIKDIHKNDAERRELYKRISGLSDNIIFNCEDVELYKMISDTTMTNEGCYKKDFQQIAFKVSITNVSGRKISFTLNDEFFADANDLGYHVRLNADGVRMEGCTLAPFFDHHEENHKTFEPPLYTKGFRKVVLRPQESIVGWVGFYLTPEAKNLELLFADEYVILKNPALEGD